MNKYKNFSLEDFLQDKFFIEWINAPFLNNNEIWESWLKNNPEKIEIVEEAKKIIQAFEFQPKPIQEDFYEKLKTRIDFTIDNSTSKKATPVYNYTWLKIAAIFAGLIIGARLLFRLPVEEKSVSYTYSSKFGETKRVLLPDSSEVLLNANSLLKFKADSKKGSREVWLNGEGFFKIRHIVNADNKSPEKFIVHAKNVNVEVLGTQFNVNSNDTVETDVLLTKGQVRLSVSERSVQAITMLPGELVTYNNTTRNIKVNTVIPDNYLAWIDHKYIFEKTSVEELSKELYHYYGKPFTVTDPRLKKQKLSGTLELQDKKTLITTLSALLNVSVKETGDQVIIGSR